MLGEDDVVRVQNTRELGLLLRQGRRDRGLSQQELAEKIGASRHWVMDVEKGKPTAEMGLALKALSALDMTFDVRRSGVFAAKLDSPSVPVPDLGEVLSRTTGKRIGPMRSGTSVEKRSRSKNREH